MWITDSYISIDWCNVLYVFDWFIFPIPTFVVWQFHLTVVNFFILVFNFALNSTFLAEVIPAFPWQPRSVLSSSHFSSSSSALNSAPEALVN